MYGKYFHPSLMFMGHVYKTVLILVAILLKFQLNLQKKNFYSNKERVERDLDDFFTSEIYSNPQ